jgi:hypothetical protein
MPTVPLSAILVISFCLIGQRAHAQAAGLVEDTWRLLRPFSDDLVRMLPKSQVRQIVRVRQAPRTLTELASTGRRYVTAEEISRAEPRADVAAMREELIEAGFAVQEAHCEGLNMELREGRSLTYADYVALMVVHYVKGQLPVPPERDLVGKAKGLVAAADKIRVIAFFDPASYRAEIARSCRIL